MTDSKMSLKNDNPKKEAPKKEAYPEWPGTEDAELGVKYKNAKGNIIQKGQSK